MFMLDSECMFLNSVFHSFLRFIIFLSPIQEKQNQSFGERNGPTRPAGTQGGREVPVKPGCGDHKQDWVSLFAPMSSGETSRFPCHKILTGCK